MNLKDILEAFVRHRREVVTRRTVYLLKKARERGHLLEGLAVAISNIDEVIELIRQSPTPGGCQGALDCARLEAWNCCTVVGTSGGFRLSPG
jgi:DNA gyrase subunit A